MFCLLAAHATCGLFVWCVVMFCCCGYYDCLVCIEVIVWVCLFWSLECGFAWLRFGFDVW